MPEKLGGPEYCEGRGERDGRDQSNDLGQSARDDEQPEHDFHGPGEQRKAFRTRPERGKDVQDRHLVEHRVCHVRIRELLDNGQGNQGDSRTDLEPEGCSAQR